MSKTAYLTGSAKWAKLSDPDEKYGGSWQLDLYLDDDGWSIFNDLNLELSVRENEDGKFIKLRRPVQKILKGELVKFDPPLVVDAKKKRVETLVGNGSKVVCKVSVYPTAKGNAHRLESVMVTELVEYSPPETIKSDSVVEF